MQPDVEARFLTGKVQKRLVKLNAAFRNSLDAEEELNEVFNDLDRLKALADENTHVSDFVTAKASSDSLITLFKDVKSKYYDSKQLLERFQDRLESADNFMERFRTYRHYEFKDDDSFLKFLKSAAKSCDVTEFWVKPEMLGSVKLNKVAEELKLQQQGKMYTLVPVDYARKVFDLVLAQNPNSGLFLESHPLSMLWRPSNNVKVDAGPKHLRDLDDNARLAGAKVLDK